MDTKLLGSQLLGAHTALQTTTQEHMSWEQGTLHSLVIRPRIKDTCKVTQPDPRTPFHTQPHSVTGAGSLHSLLITPAHTHTRGHTPDAVTSAFHTEAHGPGVRAGA